MHDVLDLRDIVADEWRHLDSAGHDVAALREPVLAAVERGDLEALAGLRSVLAEAQLRADWPYEEPSALEDIVAALGGPPPAPAHWTGTDAELRDRVHAAWVGRCIGCAMGKPVEGLDRASVERYLRAAGAWPLHGYVPLLDPLPDGIDALHWSAPESGLGRFDAAPRDDDTDYTVLGLHLLETYGAGLTPADVAREWLDRLPFTQTYTAERAAYRNLVSGLAPEAAAHHDNPYREWIGALIRADALGYACPGDPATAVRLAHADASLSHVGNGIYGELWAAALVASAFTASGVREALGVARGWVPPRSRLREALDLVEGLHDAGADWPELVRRLDGLVGHYDWVHTINNAAGIAAALLWGEGDLPRSVGSVVALGWDTDSSGATVGSVLGALHGPGVLPAELAAPLHDELRSALRDYDRSSLTALADRTVAVRRRLQAGTGAGVAA